MADVDADTCTVKIWLMGNGEILYEKDVPLEEGQRIVADLVQAFEEPTVVGSVSFGSGRIVRYAAVAAVELQLPRQRGMKSAVLR